MEFAQKLSTRIITVAVAGIAAVVLGWTGFNQAAAGHHLAAMIATGLTMLAGSTIITTWPIAGTFPTSAQAVNFNTQIYRVVTVDADTTAVLTHNWGISAAQLAAFFPLISFYVENIGATFPPVSFALTDSNTVTMTKLATTGSGATLVVTLQRPYSATQ
jgi:hypothetical protein